MVSPCDRWIAAGKASDAKAKIRELFDRDKNGQQVQGLSPAFLFNLPERPLSLFANGLPDEISLNLLPGHALKLKKVAEGHYEATELLALHCQTQNPAPFSLSALWLEQAELLTAQLAAAFLVEANQHPQSSQQSMLARFLHEL